MTIQWPVGLFIIKFGVDYKWYSDPQVVLHHYPLSIYQNIHLFNKYTFISRALIRNNIILFYLQNKSLFWLTNSITSVLEDFALSTHPTELRHGLLLFWFSMHFLSVRTTAPYFRQVLTLLPCKAFPSARYFHHP